MFAEIDMAIIATTIFFLLFDIKELIPSNRKSIRQFPWLAYFFLFLPLLTLFGLAFTYAIDYSFDIDFCSEDFIFNTLTFPFASFVHLRFIREKD